LSHYGGPNAAVQYRVWAKTVDGKTFYHADEEFQGIIIAWRKFQQDLEYYTDIGLPVAVVWDAGLRGYREVELDTMLPWIKAEARDWYETYKQRERDEAEKEKAAIMERRRSILGEMESLPPQEEVERKHAKKTRKGKREEYTAETISSLQTEELREQQKVTKELEGRAEKLKKEEAQEQNPKRQSLRDFIKENRDDIDRLIENRLGGPMTHKNDEERRQWILNDEGLYTWARRAGVLLENPTSYQSSRRFLITDIVRYLSPSLSPAGIRELRQDLRFQSLRALRKMWNDLRGKNPLRRNQWQVLAVPAIYAIPKILEYSERHPGPLQYLPGYYPRRHANPRRRNPSYAYVEPQNREAYLRLKEFTETGGWAWQRVGNMTWQSRLLVGLDYLNDLADDLEEDGFVFKKKEGQKPGPIDFIAFVAW